MGNICNFSQPTLFQKIPALIYIAAGQGPLIATSHNVYEKSIQKGTATEMEMVES